MTPHAAHGPPERAAWFRHRTALVPVAFLAINAFSPTEHAAQTLRFLSLGLLLLCPLLHLVLHGGHGGHASDHDRRAHGDTP